MAQKTSFLTNELSKRNNINTKDFSELKKNDEIIVFVYGTLRVGQSNFRLLKDQKYLGEAATVTDNFCMYDTNNGFPTVSVWKQGDRGTAGFVYGELFAVKPLVMLELDRLEGNGMMYQREQKYFWAYDQRVISSETTRSLYPSAKAWIYLSVPGFWSEADLSLCTKVKPDKATKVFYDWIEDQKDKSSDKNEPSYGTPEYYERYYGWHNGRYIETAKSK